MIQWIAAEDVKTARHAGLAGDLPGIYIRIISTVSGRSERLTRLIWINTVRAEILSERDI